VYKKPGYLRRYIETGYRLDGWGSIPGRARDFSPLHSVQTVSGAHPVSYPLGKVKVKLSL
jgi:hypothetical protein